MNLMSDMVVFLNRLNGGYLQAILMSRYILFTRITESLKCEEPDWVG